MVIVQANSSYPLDWRMIVQSQSPDHEAGVGWIDDGPSIELAPGGKTKVRVVAGAARVIVSSESDIQFWGRVLFGGNEQIRIVTEGWNGQAWYDHAVDEEPVSPEHISPWKDGFRYRIESI